MLNLVLQRLFYALLTLVLVAMTVFAMTELLPGDICTAMLGRNARGEKLENCRIERQLERPATERFLEWAGKAAQGDFGVTGRRATPISDVLGIRLRNTFVLGISAALIGIPIAIGLGIISALRRDTKLDVAVSSISIFAMTLPDFVTATLLVFIFSISLGWFPAITLVNPDAPISQLLPNIVLPVISLTFIMVAHILRLVRTSMIEVMSSDYVQMATLKGVPFRQIVIRHALPNALLPTINIIALTLAWLLGGVVITEAIFNYPGIGTLTINAISDRDIPLVQSIALVLAALYIGVNLIADLLTLVLNPRLRTHRT